ncbi:MAG: aldehyde dehydrogenase family protein, partial [Polyangia bacterium]|nr:aldehyde dehydrogenase family protein [Polyangia bacterium]
MQIPELMYIDGAFTEGEGSERLEVRNPATEELLLRIPVATAADLDRALGAAERGHRAWRDVDAWTRS